MYVVAKNIEDAKKKAFEKRYPSVYRTLIEERGTVERVTIIIPKGYRVYMVSHSIRRK